MRVFFISLVVSCCLFIVPSSVAAQLEWQTIPKPAPLATAVASGMIPTKNGEQVYYETHGKKGKWLIFLHGGTDSVLAWGNQVPEFSKGYRVLLIESRGHGRSTWDGTALHYQRMADDVVTVMNALKIAKASIVGWSDGGITALMMGINYPDRVSRLVAFGANAEASNEVYDFDNLAKPPYTAENKRTEEAYKLLSATPQRWEHFRDAVYSMWETEPHIMDQLPLIEAPCLIAVGQYDVISVAHASDMAAAIPHAKLVVIPDASHFAPLHAPSKFNQLIERFLQNI